jgi:hypothetical protein
LEQGKKGIARVGIDNGVEKNQVWVGGSACGSVGVPGSELFLLPHVENVPKFGDGAERGKGIGLSGVAAVPAELEGAVGEKIR